MINVIVDGPYKGEKNTRLSGPEFPLMTPKDTAMMGPFLYKIIWKNTTHTAWSLYSRRKTRKELIAKGEWPCNCIECNKEINKWLEEK